MQSPHSQDPAEMMNFCLPPTENFQDVLGCHPLTSTQAMSQLGWGVLLVAPTAGRCLCSTAWDVAQLRARGGGNSRALTGYLIAASNIWILREQV